MTFPPPPGLIFLAYQFGSITKAEMNYLMKKWREKYEKEDRVSGD